MSQCVRGCVNLWILSPGLLFPWLCSWRVKISPECELQLLIHVQYNVQCQLGNNLLWFPLYLHYQVGRSTGVHNCVFTCTVPVSVYVYACVQCMWPCMWMPYVCRKTCVCVNMCVNVWASVWGRRSPFHGFFKETIRLRNYDSTWLAEQTVFYKVMFKIGAGVWITDFWNLHILKPDIQYFLDSEGFFFFS